jgi:hypothetical protein
MARPVLRTTRPPLLVLGLLAVCAPALAEIPVVENPAEPAEGAATLELEELWRLGGDSEADAEFFGVINSVTEDAEGNVYLLDGQLSEIRVFDDDGEYLRTIGREGEGPGEFRTPRGFFFLPGGNVGVVNLRPATIVLLSPDGDPAGNFEPSGVDAHGMLMIRGAGRAGDRVVLAFSEMQRTESGMDRRHRLCAFNESGELLTTYAETTSRLDFANPVFREGEMGVLDWTGSRDGHLFLVPQEPGYRIRVFDPDGNPSLEIVKEHELRLRTDAEKEEMRSRIVIRGIPNPTIEINDHAPAIVEMHARDDGSLWVIGGNDGEDLPEGMIARFDVFNREGRYVRRVALKGEGAADGDLFHFIGNRLYVVRHYADAARAQFAGAPGHGDGPALEPGAAEPISVICYRVPELP